MKHIESPAITKLHLVACILSGLLSLSALWAQSERQPVPRLVKFNGVVKDDASHLKAGVVAVTFALYRDQDGGAPLWLETQNVQADAKGTYTVLLGSTKPDGLPADLFSSNEARWLGVQPEGQSEQPHVLFVSVPYALKAADAETLGGKPPSAFQLVPPPGQKGSPPNTSPLVSGVTAAFSSNTASPVLNVSQTGTGVENGVAVFGQLTGGSASGVKGLSGAGSGQQQPTGVGVWGDTASNGIGVLATVDQGTGVEAFTNGSASAFFGESLTTSPDDSPLLLQAPKFGNVGSFTNVSIGADGGLFMHPDAQPNSTGLLAGDPGCGAGFGGLALGSTTFDDFRTSPCTTVSIIGDVNGNTYINSSLSRGGTIHLRHDNSTTGIPEVLVGDPGCGQGFAAIGIGALNAPVVALIKP